MPHENFLELLQLVEKLRMCEGKLCIVVPEAAIAKEREVMDAMRQHFPDGAASNPHPIDCPGCTDLNFARMILRETLHSNGVTLADGALPRFSWAGDMSSHIPP